MAESLALDQLDQLEERIAIALTWVPANLRDEPSDALDALLAAARQLEQSMTDRVALERKQQRTEEALAEITKWRDEALEYRRQVIEEGGSASEQAMYDHYASAYSRCLAALARAGEGE